MPVDNTTSPADNPLPNVRTNPTEALPGGLTLTDKAIIKKQIGLLSAHQWETMAENPAAILSRLSNFDGKPKEAKIFPPFVISVLNVTSNIPAPNAVEIARFLASNEHYHQVTGNPYNTESFSFPDEVLDSYITARNSTLNIIAERTKSLRQFFAEPDLTNGGRLKLQEWVKQIFSEAATEKGQNFSNILREVGENEFAQHFIHTMLNYDAQLVTDLPTAPIDTFRNGYYFFQINQLKSLPVAGSNAEFDLAIASQQTTKSKLISEDSEQLNPRINSEYLENIARNFKHTTDSSAGLINLLNLAKTIEDTDHKALAINSLISIHNWLKQPAHIDVNIAAELQAMTHLKDQKLADSLDAFASVLQSASIEKIKTNLVKLVDAKLLVKAINNAANAGVVGLKEALTIENGNYRLPLEVRTNLHALVDSRERIYANGQKIEKVNDASALPMAGREIISLLGLPEGTSTRFAEIDQSFAHLITNIILAKSGKLNSLITEKNQLAKGILAPIEVPGDYIFSNQEGNVHVQSSGHMLFFRNLLQGDKAAPFDCKNEYDFCYVNDSSPYYQLEEFAVTGKDQDIARALIYEPVGSSAFEKAVDSINKRLEMEKHYKLGEVTKSLINPNITKTNRVDQEKQALGLELHAIAIKFYRASKQADVALECLQEIESLKVKHAAVLSIGNIAGLLEKFEVSIATANNQATDYLRYSKTKEQIEKITASPADTVFKVLQAYEAGLEKNAALKKIMTQPARMSRFVDEKGQTTTQSHSRIIKQAKEKIYSIPEQSRTAEQKAFLKIQRKSGKSNWRSIALGIGVGLAIAAGITATVLTGGIAGIAISAGLGIAAGLGVLGGGATYLAAADLSERNNITAAKAYHIEKEKAAPKTIVKTLVLVSAPVEALARSWGDSKKSVGPTTSNPTVSSSRPNVPTPITANTTTDTSAIAPRAQTAFYSAQASVPNGQITASPAPGESK